MSKPVKAAVRCNSLTIGGHGPDSLAVQERHGKREDGTSQRRKVRDLKPIVWGGLDLCNLYDKHMSEVSLNKGCKRPVLHFIIKMPEQLLTDDAPLQYRNLDIDGRKKLMGTQAISFINQTHGDRAVFAARVDRDEAGELVVDIFAAPKYEKTTKNRGKSKTATWASPTKFGKELAIKHQREIEERHPDAKGVLTGPRYVGIALQSEFAEFFELVNGVKLSRNRKRSSDPDRLDTEAYKEMRDAQDKLELDQSLAKAQEMELEGREAELEAHETELEGREAVLEGREEGLEWREEAIGKRKLELDKREAEARQLWKDALSKIAEANKLVEALRKGLLKVYKLLKRDDLSAEVRADATDIAESTQALISTTKKPLDESGPGF